MTNLPKIGSSMGTLLTSSINASATASIVGAVDLPVTSYKGATSGKINELHFLVHPLFSADPENWEGDPLGFKRAKGRMQILADAYQDQARSMSNGAFMCAILHKNSVPVEEENPEYTRTLHTLIGGLRSILGTRLMTFYGGVNPFEGDSFVKQFVKNLRDASFDLSESPSLLVYGETLGECVRDAAENLKYRLGLREPVQIPIQLTEARFLWRKTSKRKRTIIEQEFRDAGLRLVANYAQF